MTSILCLLITLILNLYISLFQRDKRLFTLTLLKQSFINIYNTLSKDDVQRLLHLLHCLILIVMAIFCLFLVISS